jgi:hypothetical protein
MKVTLEEAMEVRGGKLKLKFKLNGTYQLLVCTDGSTLLADENVSFSQAMGHETIIFMLIL